MFRYGIAVIYAYAFLSVFGNHMKFVYGVFMNKEKIAA